MQVYRVSLKFVEHHSILSPPPGSDRTYQEFSGCFTAIGELTGHIRTHDLQSFPVKVEGKRIYVKV
jgi:hypothetical protein